MKKSRPYVAAPTSPAASGMRIAVASAKGGTGKTMLATALASLAASRYGLSSCYVDCDVEAPNGHLLLHPSIAVRRPVTYAVPQVEEGHGEGSIREVSRVMGYVEAGRAGPVRFVGGTLELGQPRPSRLIEEALKEIPLDADLVVIDTPSGTSCPQVVASKTAHLLLLVADATPFGRVDLGIMLDLIRRRLGVDYAVVINRGDVGDHRLRELCASEGIPVVGTIPWSRTIARAYARGQLDAIARKVEDVLTSALEMALTRAAGPSC